MQILAVNDAVFHQCLQGHLDIHPILFGHSLCCYHHICVLMFLTHVSYYIQGCFGDDTS